MVIRDIQANVDRVEADIVVLTFFEDERPLRTHAGLADWRMNGALSRLIMDGSMSGREGESMIMTTDGRIRSTRLLLYGLGEAKLFNASRFKEILPGFIKVLCGLDMQFLAASIPGSSLFSMKDVREAFKGELKKARFRQDAEIIVLNSD